MRLELESVADDAVVYRVHLELPDRTCASRATIALPGGAISFAELSDPAPPWLVESARAFLRTLYRERARDDAGPWPRKLHRWRTERGRRG